MTDKAIREHRPPPPEEIAGEGPEHSAGLMHQAAPYPHVLAELVDQLSYRESEGWRVWLADDFVRDKPHDGHPDSKGLTLIVLRDGPDSYHPERRMRVNHYFPVPPATYNRRSWQWWLFERIGLVELHERMENFKIGGKPAYPPAHGPGNSPYLVLEYGTDTDRRTSFRGELNPPLAHECEHQASNFTPCRTCGA